MERHSSGEGPSSPSSSRRLITAGQVFDGTKLLREALVVLQDGIVEYVGPRSDYTSSSSTETVENLGEDTLLTCGMMDLQMNGGGGLQFNEDISETTLEKMLEVCLEHGTSSFMPTMLTSSFDDLRSSLEVVKAWVAKHGLTRGVVGIHLEGPFLSQEKKGIHMEALLQEATQEKLDEIAGYAALFPVLMTVAPEKVSTEQVKRMTEKGVVLSIGHSKATYEVTKACLEAGASAATHLFNAMSGLSARDPGVIGAVLNHPSCYVGIIADLHHVHPANIEIAARLKPDNLMMVTDCHSPAGTELQHSSSTAGRCTCETGDA